MSFFLLFIPGPFCKVKKLPTKQQQQQNNSLNLYWWKDGKCFLNSTDAKSFSVYMRVCYSCQKLRQMLVFAWLPFSQHWQRRIHISVTHLLAQGLLRSLHNEKIRQKSNCFLLSHRHGLTFGIIYHMPYIPKGSLDVAIADAESSNVLKIWFLSSHTLLLLTKYVLCYLMMLSDAAFLTLSQISNPLCSFPAACRPCNDLEILKAICNSDFGECLYFSFIQSLALRVVWISILFHKSLSF